jgi:hypothetical protein
MMLSISVSWEKEIFLPVDVAKVAMSDGPFGTVAGVQLVAVFQSLPAGFTFQVALPP